MPNARILPKILPRAAILFGTLAAMLISASGVRAAERRGRLSLHLWSHLRYRAVK